MRVLAGVAGLVCLWPTGVVLNVAGAAAVIALIVLNARGLPFFAKAKVA